MVRNQSPVKLDMCQEKIKSLGHNGWQVEPVGKALTAWKSQCDAKRHDYTMLKWHNHLIMLNAS